MRVFIVMTNVLCHSDKSTQAETSLAGIPDVILLGEMRDYERPSIQLSIVAETSHPTFSSLHTIGAANTIDRIIDAFPASQQHQIAIQLASVLQAKLSARSFTCHKR